MILKGIQRIDRSHHSGMGWVGGYMGGYVGVRVPSGMDLSEKDVSRSARRGNLDEQCQRTDYC